MSGRIKQLCKYLKENCKVAKDLTLLKDDRVKPNYSTQMMVMSCLLSFICRTRSTRQLCRRLKKKGWRRFLGIDLSKSTPVEGTFRNFYPKLHTISIRKAMISSVKRMRISKMHQRRQFDGLHVVSIDGTQPFSTHHFNCTGCIKHKSRRSNAEKDDPPASWYDHRIVTARLIGDSFSPWLGFISQKPKTDKGGYEGEQTAVPRLLTQLEEDYGRNTIDVILTDALHVTNSFIQECERHGWWATFISKKNASSLKKGFEYKPLGEPVVVTKKIHEGVVEATIWRQENIYLSTCSLPLQVLKIHQVVKNMAGKILREDIRWIGSRIPVGRLSAEKLWWMGWRRWESENGGHRNFKRDHHAKHIFCHGNSIAVENIFWMLMWSQNLLEAFGLRRLQSGRFGGLRSGLIGLVEEIVEGLAANPSSQLFFNKELRVTLWHGG